MADVEIVAVEIVDVEIVDLEVVDVEMVGLAVDVDGVVEAEPPEEEEDVCAVERIITFLPKSVVLTCC